MHSACSAPTHAKRVNARFDKVQKSNNEEKSKDSVICCILSVIIHEHNA